MRGSVFRMPDVRGSLFLVPAVGRSWSDLLCPIDWAPATSEDGGFRLPPESLI